MRSSSKEEETRNLGPSPLLIIVPLVAGISFVIALFPGIITGSTLTGSVATLERLVTKPCTTDVPFDRKAWLEDSQCRLAMLKDLQSQYHLTGLSESEIHKLLGAPMGEPMTPEGVPESPDLQPGPDGWVGYHLGSHGEDSQTTLWIHFSHHAVDKFYVHHDT